MSDRRSPVAAAATAFLLAPCTAELLSGSSPPHEFFAPGALVLKLTLYGCGVVVVHELALAWRAGWRGILLLGAAFGLLSEGLAAKSVLDPSWPDLGLLAHYGRWIGINWVWAECLVLQHAVLAIALPLLLVELLWPESRGQRWMDGAARRMFALGLVAALVAAALLLPGPLSPLPALGLVAAAGLFAAAARRWRPRPPRTRRRRPLTVGLVALAAQLALLWTMLAVPQMSRWPATPTFLLIALVAGGLARWYARAVAGAWTERHTLAVVTGLLLVWIALAPLQQADAGRAEDTSGMAAVGLLTAVGLIGLTFRVRRRQRLGPQTIT